MGLSVFIFIALMFFANIDRISRIKATKEGFEAETREVINEAKNTIKELQEMAKLMATTELSLVMRSGRIGGYSEEEKEERRAVAIEILDQLKIPDAEKDKVLSEWHKFVIVDYVHCILGRYKVPKDLTPAQTQKWNQLRQRGLDNPPAPDEVRDFLSSCNRLNNDVEELVRDYEHYLAHKAHRRPEVWRNHENWDHMYI